MKKIFISLVLLLGCTPTDDFMDDKQAMLTSGFSGYDNFFPLVTLDLSDKGIHDKIHVMYVCLDPDIDQEKAFPGSDYIDEFSFQIMKDGKYRPTFNKSALAIGKDFEFDFETELSNYKKAKADDQILQRLMINDKLEWWQHDQTPKNSKGKPMTFICQLDMGRIINDDCRLYVFYDQNDRIVKYIYQRD